MERYPGIRFILSHAGGTVPYLAWRISLGEWLPGMNETAPQGVIAYLKRLYYDTALSTTGYALRPLQELVDTSQIVFGSDYPFLPEPLIAMTVDDLQRYDGFDRQALTASERDNARTLFPRLK